MVELYENTKTNVTVYEEDGRDAGHRYFIFDHNISRDVAKKKKKVHAGLKVTSDSCLLILSQRNCTHSSSK